MLRSFATAFAAVTRWLDYACGAVSVACLGAMVILTGAQIVCRLWFEALTWSEELTRYLMIWATFLGAGCVYRRAGHISVTVVQNMVPAALGAAMRVACHMLCGAFFIIAVIYGWDYMAMQSRQLSAAMRIPMSWMYLVIPVGFGIMTLHVVDNLLRPFAGGEERGQ